MLHLLIIPSFALSEGGAGCGAASYQGLLNFCLSRLLCGVVWCGVACGVSAELTELRAAPHTFPSQGSWGALTKPAPFWPLRAPSPTWVSPTSPDTDWPLSWRWASLVLSIQCPGSLGMFFTWSCPHIVFFALQSHSCVSRSSFQAQGVSSCQHISGCICHTPTALWVCRQTPFEQPWRPVLL